MANARPAGAKDTARRDGHWIECQFVDSAGYPLGGTPYQLTLPDGSRSDGKLGSDGAIRRDVPEPGRYEVVLADVRTAEWGSPRARVGEPVSMGARAVGFEDGAPAVFVVYRRGIRDADAMVDAIEAAVTAGQVSATWTLDAARGATLDSTEEHPTPAGGEFYFEVVAGATLARSGSLRVVDDLDLSLGDGAGNPAAFAGYVLLLPDGTARRGQLDAQGRATERDVPPGVARAFLVARPRQ